MIDEETIGASQKHYHTQSDIVRFWSKVDIRSPDDCWPWLASNIRGYGTISIKSRRRMAQQVAWEIHHNEPFPKGKGGCHSCDFPPCVNPLHIWPGTQLENSQDAKVKGRLKPPPRNTYCQDKKHCKRGHPLSGDNVFINSQGSRSCDTCMKMHRKNWQERHPDRLRDPIKNRKNANRWAKANPEKVKENARKQREKNREKTKEYLKEYYKANKAKMNEQSRLRYQRKREQKTALTEAGIVKPTGETIRSGFIDIPVCELQPPFREPTHAEAASKTGDKGRGR